MIEDAELLRRYAEENSEPAFAELVQRHLSLVYGCALRRVGGDSQLAEDITQQVFTDVARRASILARRPVLAGWLFTGARFAAAKAMRGARRRLDRERKAHLMHEASTNPTVPFDWENTRPVLDHAIAELNERDREAILLRFFEGREFPSIGAKLKLTDNAARMRVERALEKLRAQLEHRGVTSCAAAIATVLAQQTAVAVPVGLAAQVTSAALAGGALAAGAGAAAKAITFMSVTKLQMGIAGALIVAGTAGFVIQTQHTERLRRDVARLQQEIREIDAVRAENQRLKAIATEVATLRPDDASLAGLRDDAATLQARLRNSATKVVDSGPPANTPSWHVSERIGAALQGLKPLQEAKNWPGMTALIEGLIPQVEASSFDMAFLLDLKARILIQQDRYNEAIAPWEKALQLSRQYNYFDEKQSLDIAHFIDQLQRSKNLGSGAVPARPWF